MIKRLMLLLVLVLSSPSRADEDTRVLIEFDSESSKAWQAVNDGVMGGRSDGRFQFNDDQNMEFLGTLSLENNGGFASVRLQGAKLELAKDEVILLRVRGDGREYNFNLYVSRNVSRNSYRQAFKTKKDEWIEVSLPLEKFVATWRGRVFPNEKLNASDVTGVGILLGDKKAGPFKLEVDWIKAAPIEKAGESD